MHREPLSKTARAWAWAGAGALASFILGGILLGQGHSMTAQGNDGSSLDAWGVVFLLLPFLIGAIAVVFVIARELARDLDKERAWKQTLTPEQRTAVEVVETAALFAAWGVVHESVVKGREREAARVDQRQADRARQAVQQRNIRPRQQ